MSRIQLLVIGIVGTLVLGSIAILTWLVVTRDTRTPERGQMETTRFETQDGVTLVGDVYRPTASPKGGVLLIHMLPADRSSWQEFGSLLAERGYLALAIDLRGHGESTSQGTTTLDFQTFSDAEHQQSSLDVEAATTWLLDQGIPLSRIGLVGASIGANLALEKIAKTPEIRWAVLLSPGLVYKGLATPPLLERLRPTQRLLLVASQDDPYAYQTITDLAALSPGETRLRQLAGAGHGTTMWEQQPSELEATLNWIESGYSNG